MFDFGLSFSHIMVIVILAVVVIGPKDLPVVLRKLGQGIAKMRGMARDFQGQMDAAMKDSGMANVRQDIASIATGVSAVMAPMQTALVAAATATPAQKTDAGAAPIAAALPTSSGLGGLSFAEGEGEVRVLGRRLTQADA